MTEKTKTPKHEKIVGAVVLTPEEAAREMEKLVDEKEKDIDEKEKVRLIEHAEEADKAKVAPKEYSGKSRGKGRYTREDEKVNLDNWVPKTELGRLVKSGKIKSFDEILESGRKVMESEIADSLLTLNTELLDAGQAKGKFGGGKRRSWRQTQKKTQEGNILTFSVLAVVGDGNGHVGLGFGRAAETLPAREKAIRQAKINVVRIKRGCASYDCSCKETHSIPFTTFGKCSSVELTFMPAPQGTGLVVGDQVKKILRLAGIRDVYGKAFGKTRTTINVAKACMHALNKLSEFRE